jgi:hypothetical protein
MAKVKRISEENSIYVILNNNVENLHKFDIMVVINNRVRKVKINEKIRCNKDYSNIKRILSRCYM